MKIVSVAQEMIVNVNQQKENRLDYAIQRVIEIADTISTEITPARDIIKSVINFIDQRQSSKSEITGLSTGFIALNKITNGLHAGDLIVLAGRPSMGKTIFAMNIAEHVAIHENKPVAVFSLEMSKEQLIERSLVSIAKVNADHVKSGQLSNNDFKKISSVIPHFHTAKLFIDDRACIDVSSIRARCRRIKREHGLSLVIVDYITLMSGDGENETIRLGHISRGLKLLARDLNVPVIVISQLNRSLEQRSDKRPNMADLRQSGAIEQDADLILFVYRDEIYNKNSIHKGVAEIIIAKHRNGALGTVTLNFSGQHCKFNDFTGSLEVKLVNENKWHGSTFNY